MRLALRMTLAGALFAAALPAAQAAPLSSALDILHQFNVVAGSGDFSAEVGGRTVIGGTLSNGTAFYTAPGAAAASDFRGLTVYGNDTDRNGVTVRNGGGATILGTAPGGVQLSGGGSLSVNGSGTPAPNPLPAYATTFQAPLATLSQDLASLAANSSWSPNGAQTTVIRASAGTGLAVFSIAASSLQSLKSFSIDLNGRAGAIVNVTGNYNGKESLLNGTALARDIIWNFIDATKVDFGKGWGGTVLAPNAAVSNDGAVSGMLFARSVDANAPWWSAPFENALPLVAEAPPARVSEPAGIGLMLLWLLCLGWVVRNRGGRPAAAPVAA